MKTKKNKKTIIVILLLLLAISIILLMLWPRKQNDVVLNSIIADSQQSQDALDTKEPNTEESIIKEDNNNELEKFPEIEDFVSDPDVQTVYAYWVNFFNTDGTLLQREMVKEGTIPEYYGETPTYSDSSYIYTFIGWDSNITTVYGTQNYTAKYDKTQIVENRELALIGNTAYESFEDALLAVQNNDTIVLLNDISYTGDEICIQNDISFTIDGNGKKITAENPSSTNSSIFLNLNPTSSISTVNIKNLSLDVNGYAYAIVYNSDDNGYYTINGELDNVTIESEGVCIGVSGNDYGDSNVILNNCKMTNIGPIGNLNNYYYTAVAAMFDGNITINNGEYSGINYACYIYSTGGIIDIRGGSFSAPTVLEANYTSSYSNVHQASEIYVSDGTFSGNLNESGTEASIIITGGVYDVDPYYYVQYDYFVHENTPSEGKWTVDTDCLAKGTRITMADNSFKNIEDIQEGDMVLTYNHEEGKFEAQKVFLVWKSQKPKCAFTLHFENDVCISVIGDHVFFEKESLQYVPIIKENANDFIGKHFYNAKDNQYIELLSVEYDTEPVDYYEIYTANNFNCIAESMLNVPYDSMEPLNIYEFNEDLTINHEQLENDIALYGLYEYNDDAPYSKEIFDSLGWKYVNIMVGKELGTFEEFVTRRDNYLNNY